MFFLFGEPHLQDNSLENLLSRVHFYEEQHKYDSALLTVQEGILESRKLDNFDYLSKFYIRQGSILGRSGKVNESILSYEKAIRFFSGNDTIMGKAYLGLGAAYQMSSILDSSIHYYKLAEPLLIKIKDSSNLAGLFSNLALIENKTNNFTQAVSHLKASLLLRQKNRDSVGLTDTYRNIGEVQYKNANYDEALHNFETSLNIAQTKNLTQAARTALNGIIRSYVAKQDFQNSSRYILLYDSMVLNTLHQDYSDKILELETKFRTAEIERDNAVKQAQIETQDRRLIFLYSIAGFLALAILGVYVYNEQRKKIIRALALQKEKENNQRVEDLLRQQELKSAYAMLAGQEKAYKRIAEELHDNLGSILVTLNMFADSLQTKKDPAAQKELAKKISEVAQIANEATRTISHSLSSGVLKHFGLASAVAELTNALNESQSIQVVSHIQVENQLDSEISLNIYRIVQELINNTLKHGQATRINIELTQIHEQLSLIYEDNGVGFDMATVRSGMGLHNLESRVERMNGEITIDSKRGKGTTVILDIPV